MMIQNVGVARGSCGAGGMGCPTIVFRINTTINGSWQFSASITLTNPFNYENVFITAET
jgi:hypothetical protein